jgi:hypothetical protein
MNTGVKEEKKCGLEDSGDPPQSSVTKMEANEVSLLPYVLGRPHRVSVLLV